MSDERVGDLRPERRNETEHVASMRLRAERPRVTRLSRKVLVGGAAIASIAISGAVLWALQNNRSRTVAPEELYTTDRRNVADGVTSLPRDYAGLPRQAPQLGPPLPGDLGAHQASSASLATIMTALYCAVLRPQDSIAVKPHASPIYHALQYLFGNQTREKLENFRGFKGACKAIRHGPRMLTTSTSRRGRLGSVTGGAAFATPAHKLPNEKMPEEEQMAGVTELHYNSSQRISLKADGMKLCLRPLIFLPAS